MERVVILLSLLSVCWCYDDFSGYKVYRIIPQTENQVVQLNSLLDKYDLWKEPSNVRAPVDVMTYGDQDTELYNTVSTLGLTAEVWIEDVEALMQNEISKTQKRSQDFRFDVYHNYAEILSYLNDTASKHPDLVTLVQVGTSYEGRPIMGLKISGSPQKNKRVMWLDSGIHAREWVAPAWSLYLINQLVTRYEFEDVTQEILNNLELWIVPVVNPDGYVYTWTNNRLWRKNRSPNNGTDCVGTDLNRNFDAQWATVGSSSNPCRQTFHGSRPFSEPESRDLAATIRSLNVVGFFTYHSYSQMFLTPYGYKFDYAPDFYEQLEVCIEADCALSSVHNNIYRCDSIINIIGPAAGSSIDYMYDVLNIKFSYGVELRDLGRYGFLLPDSQIIPTSEENFEAFRVFATEIIKRT